MTELSAVEWVRLAASREETRPVLTCVCVDEDGKRLVATDGRRLHVATLTEPAAFRPGLWRRDLTELTNVTYPKWQQITAGIEQTHPTRYELAAHRPDAVAPLSRVLAAASLLAKPPQLDIGAVAIPSANDKPCRIDARYLAAALRGFHNAAGAPPILRVGSPLSPIHLQSADGSRIAVVMPIHLGTPALFDLAPYCIPIPAPVAVKPGTTRAKAKNVA